MTSTGFEASIKAVPAAARKGVEAAMGREG
jgi:hypothetical protein